MLPFKSIILIEKKSKTPIFLQIARQMTEKIKEGVIPTGTKLMGTRALAALLGVHRQTVVAAYAELVAQGWLETQGASGTFVNTKLPEIKPVVLNKTLIINDLKKETGFDFEKRIHLNLPALKGTRTLTFDDGYPDVRLAPLDEIARAYRTVLKKGYQKNLLFYGETKGDTGLREAAAHFMQETRGLHITAENVMITRGSMMAIYLITQTLVRPGDKVALAEMSYPSGKMIFQNAGAEIVSIRLDDQGLDVDHLAEVCEKMPIRLIYVTPHHHYPTTVTMPAARRLRLLELAKKYRFCILEDDYDYDFHYSSSPILPLASVDKDGFVVYIGSLCKSLSPAMRVGFIIAPSDMIDALGNYRRIVDRQGDNILEAALALLFNDGTIKSHLKKSLKAYHKRRDFFCAALKNGLDGAIDFTVPNGGMAVWAKYPPSVSVAVLSEKLKEKGLIIADGKYFGINTIRMGFASQSEAEIERGVAILAENIRK